ncbi:MAG TPA: ABC transporter substrate-binding protein [Stellaceae bacterium]|nr:ABC transporter substrate-binding protein [Stellaceae bacterium]
MRGWLWAAALFVALMGPPVSAKTFRWASDGDLRSLDPYAGRETFLRSFDANIYEPLVRRGRDLALEPALATNWANPAPERWRFNLRQGVVFQDGTPFSAADVLFSFARARAPTSKLAGVVAPIKEVLQVDDHTIEILTIGADPILPDELTEWGIMSRAWCEAHDATEPAERGHGEESYATDHANGTGPFMLATRTPEVETVLVPNPRWWDERHFDLDKAVFLPVPDDEVRVAELVSGTLDMIYAVPPQDIDRIARTQGLHIVQGPELRTIFLGFDQHSAELADSDVKGRNPYKDRRVREAFYRAIDEHEIAGTVMRGLATPSALMVAPGINGFDRALDKRLPYDPAAARRLLAEAGYANGFTTGMDCPSDRYVNDEAICRAVAAMLAKVGVTVDIEAQGRAQFFAKLFRANYRTSFFLFGWTPTTYDALDMLTNLAATPDPAAHAGDFNFGGYSNRALDALIARIEGETKRDARLALLREALKLLQDDVAFIPLHQQDVVWAARDGVELVQRADDAFPLRYVRLK